MNNLPLKVIPDLSMSFHPDKWNGEAVIKKANCLAYAFNRQDLGWPYLKNFVHTSTPSNFGALSLLEREDFQLSTLVRIRPQEHSPDKHHIIAFSRHMGHFFRLDGDNTWSHKQSDMAATNLDRKGNVISDLAAAHFRTAGDHEKDVERTERLLSVHKLWLDRKDYSIASEADLKSLLVEGEILLSYLKTSFEKMNGDPMGLMYFAVPEKGVDVLPHARHNI